MACGTGSVASALVAAAAGLVASPVTVVTRGGEELVVHFARRAGGDIEAVFLEGRAEVVYEGRLWEEPATAPAARGRTGRRGGR
jgi:diaminopimelate epimerase